MTNRLLDRIQGCLLGAMIGDAMGMPWEGMKHFDIAHVTKGLGVTGFTAPGPHSLPFLRHLNAGDTTDDWALTAANARALIRGKGVYILTMVVDEHLKAYHQSTVGWGRTTKRALKGIERFIESHGKEGWDPREIADPDPHYPKSGCGNGVAMKIAPLTIVNVLRERHDLDLVTDVLLHGQMTHPDPGAWTSAVAIAMMVSRQLTWTGEESWLDAVVPEFGLLDDVRGWVMHAEQVVQTGQVPPSDTFSGRLLRLQGGKADLLTVNKGGRKAKAVDVIRLLGNGYHAFESCAFAIAVALRHQDDFRTAVLEAVNAGGDADTNASMVGAIVGARVGLSGIPPEWRTFSPTFQEPIELANRLYALK